MQILSIFETSQRGSVPAFRVLIKEKRQKKVRRSSRMRAEVDGKCDEDMAEFSQDCETSRLPGKEGRKATRQGRISLLRIMDSHLFPLTRPRLACTATLPARKFKAALSDTEPEPVSASSRCFAGC